MAYDRNAKAREKGFRNYYEERKAQAQAKGFDTPYQEQKSNVQARGFTSPHTYTQYRKAARESGYGPVFETKHNPLSDYLHRQNIWLDQVPEPLQNSPTLQRAFNEGFLKPIGIGAVGGPLTSFQKRQREYFLSIIEDFDWDEWQDFVDEEGDSPGGEQ